MQQEENIIPDINGNRILLNFALGIVLYIELVNNYSDYHFVLLTMLSGHSAE